MTPKAPILVVEDDAALRAMVGELLQDRGYAVETAETGQAAWEELRNGSRPCLILLDLMMPSMTGWDFLQKIRTEPSLDGIPVVVLSGYLLGGSRDAALHATGFVKKPIEPAALLAEVERYCQP